MSVRRRKINGRWVYQARVAFQKRRTSAIRATREEARLAESELLAALKAKVGAAETAAQKPATVEALLDAYVEHLRLRGKPPETLAATCSAKSAIVGECPDLLRLAVSALDDDALFRFKAARERTGCQAS